MSICSFRNVFPSFGKRPFVDDLAYVSGKVTTGDDCSIWPGAVLRGDVNYIQLGNNVNIQDGAVLHVSHPQPTTPRGFPLVIGDSVLVGHRVILHGCSVAAAVMIGMNSVVLDGAMLESNIIVGANSLVPLGKKLDSGFLYFGSPVQQVRKLTTTEIAHIRYLCDNYVAIKDEYLAAGYGHVPTNLLSI